MTTPDELAYPDSLPDDFKVLLAAQRVPPNDPLLVVLAWHWRRIAQSHDTLMEGGMMLRVALDERIKAMTGAAQSLADVSGHLEALNRLLAEKPSIIGCQMEGELRVQIEGAQRASQGIAELLSALLHSTEGSFRRLNRERFAAAFLSGLALGAMLIPWTYSHFFSHS